jgi:hypothetical protein
VRLDTEKKYLEIDLQKKTKMGVGYSIEGVTTTPGEEMVRQLRIENNELRMRLEEANTVGGGIR